MSSDKKTEVIHVWLSIDEKKEIEDKSKAKGLSASAYLRNLGVVNGG